MTRRSEPISHARPAAAQSRPSHLELRSRRGVALCVTAPLSPAGAPLEREVAMPHYRSSIA